MAEVVEVPRSFQLLSVRGAALSLDRDPGARKGTDAARKELEAAEKGGKDVPPGHQGMVSIGLATHDDMSMSNWIATIIGPPGTNLGDRIYTLRIEIPEHYPKVPPRIWFKTKINMPGVGPDGAVQPALLAGWTKTSTMVSVLCNIRNSMKAAARLQQPPEGAEY